MINPFNVSYPNFVVGEIINPDELDVNFADIGVRLNQIIAVLNQITDGIGGDGSDIIDIGEVLPFTSPKLQGFLNELLAQLQSTAFDASGADFIGSYTIPGVTGNTVYDQLASLKTLLDQLASQHAADQLENETRLTAQDDKLAAMQTTVDDSNAGVAQMQTSKADKSNTYTKAQTDTEISQLEAQVYLDMYTKSQANGRYTQKTGDHPGTWQGINLSDLFQATGVSGVVIRTTQPAGSEGLLWYNPLTHQYTLFQNGQWRFNGIPGRITQKSARLTATAGQTTFTHGISGFNSAYDTLMVFQNSVLVRPSLISIPNGTQFTYSGAALEAGTIIDVIAFQSTPVGGQNLIDRINALEARIAALE